MKKNYQFILIFLLSLLIIFLPLFLLNQYLSTNSTSIIKEVLEEENAAQNKPIISPKPTSNHGNILSKLNTKSKDKSLTFLVLGTDERSDERSRSDSIILVKYSPASKQVTVVSVPRDSRVEIPGRGIAKINAAHAYGGIPLQILTLEKLFDIEVDHYLRVNFKGFVTIVDSLGGVKINAQKDFIGVKESGELRIKKGENRLDGKTLLAYVRFRKDKDGDYGRIKRQQEVLISVANELIKPKNLIKLPKILTIILENSETDLTILELLELGSGAADFTRLKVECYTLKTSSKKIIGIWYEIINQDDLEVISTKLTK